MLTFTSKIIDTFKIIVIISNFATMFVAAIIWWKRNKNRKGVSASEYFRGVVFYGRILSD